MIKKYLTSNSSSNPPGGRGQELSIPDFIKPQLDQKTSIHAQLSVSTGKAYCKICNKALTVSHQGYIDVQWHINGQMYLLKAKYVDSSCQCLVTEKDSLTTQIGEAEVKFTLFLLEHNLPIASADHVP